MKKYLSIILTITIIFSGLFIYQKTNATNFVQGYTFFQNEINSTTTLEYFGGTNIAGGQVFTGMNNFITDFTVKPNYVGGNGTINIEVRKIPINTFPNSFDNLNSDLLLGTSTADVIQNQTSNITFTFVNPIPVSPDQYYFIRILNNNNFNLDLEGTTNISPTTLTYFYSTDGIDGTTYYQRNFNLWFNIDINYQTDANGNIIYNTENLFPDLNATSTTSSTSAWDAYFNSSSSPFYVDCSQTSGGLTSILSYSPIGFIDLPAWIYDYFTHDTNATSSIGVADIAYCYTKKFVYGFAKALIVPPQFINNFLQDGITRAKKSFPFSLVFNSESILEQQISSSTQATSTDLIIPIYGHGSYNLINSSTLDVIGTSTKATYYDTITNIIWLATGATLVLLVL